MTDTRARPPAAADEWGFAWPAFDRIVDTLDIESLHRQGLGPLAAYRLRALGRALPELLEREERAAAAANLVAPAVLARARAAYDGTLVLLKGPEVALRYPGRARRFADLDLLPDDAEVAQKALLDAGFRLQDTEWPAPGYDERRESHHLHPIEWPGLALRIEVHKRANWVRGLEGPPNAEIFEAAVPGGHGVEGLLVPDPRHQAVLLGAHAWSVRAMGALRDLIDVAVFTPGLDPDELAGLARRWRFGEGWRTTTSVLDWLQDRGPEPFAVKVWARYLRTLREPTLLEMHLQEWVAPFWMVPPRLAVRCAAGAVAHDLLPAPRQSWATKIRQTLEAATHPRRTKSEHVRRSRQRTRR
jgi:hypothetical protein